MMAKMLPHEVSGLEVAPTLVFLHGWPESGSMWDATVSALCMDYRCVTMTMPHYGGRAASEALGYARWGYRFDEVADMIAETIKHTCPSGNVTLVAFDMGSLWGQALLEHFSHFVERVILVDVGVLATGRSTWSDICDLFKLGVIYQFFQIFAFLLGLIPGLATVADWLLIKILARTTKEHTPNFNMVSSDIGYGYFHRHLQIWLEFLCLRKPLLTTPLQKFPVQPTLFMYGTDKPLNFYSDEWFKAIENRRDGSRTVSFNASHWLMFTSPKKFVDTLHAWLQTTVRQC